MVHCLDAKSTHFSTILVISFSPIHTISQAWPLGTHCAIRHPGYWRKNQMALKFKWLIQPFFALGEFGDFQYTDCYLVSRPSKYPSLITSNYRFQKVQFIPSALCCMPMHAHTPRPQTDILGHLYFTGLTVIFISCIWPLSLSCLALWTSPCVTRQLGCWPQGLTHGTEYKHIWPFYQKHVNGLVNYPATLCILDHFCCMSVAVKLRDVTFVVGARGARLHPSATIERLRTLLFWAFEHNLIPQLLLTARLGLGIQQLQEVRTDFLLKFFLLSWQHFGTITAQTFFTFNSFVKMRRILSIQ